MLIPIGGDHLAFADTFKALSDPVRREILVLLKDGKKSAGEIAENFDMTNATISKKPDWFSSPATRITFIMKSMYPYLKK